MEKAKFFKSKFSMKRKPSISLGDEYGSITPLVEPPPQYQGFNGVATPMHGMASPTSGMLSPGHGLPSPLSGMPLPLNGMPSPVEDLVRSSVVEVERRAEEWSPYTGTDRLVIGIDIGTTFSGASFCFLENGKRPKIEDVTEYKGQATGHSKVPSVVVYDQALRPHLYGDPAAEAELEDGHVRAHCWKLHLKPRHIELHAQEHHVLEAVPPGLTVAKILQDFLRFMVESIANFIRTRRADGVQLLNKLAGSAQYILTVPNGWEVEQQEIMRRAAVGAGLVSADRAATIQFLAEGEASINYCATRLADIDWLRTVGQQVIVVDAGGGTVDITTYSVEQTVPKLMVKECAASECLLVGSATIDRQAGELMHNILQGSQWSTPQDLQALQRDFSKKIKEKFASVSSDFWWLRYGSTVYSSPAHNIDRGKLRLTGHQIASLFEHSISNTVASIQKRVSGGHTGGPPPVVAMVGGFSESPYYRSEVQRRLGSTINVCKPDGATNKAVAHGAVAWFLDGCVSSHVARYHYGVRCSVKYDPNKADHREKVMADKTYSSTGEILLPRAFGTILRKGQESTAADRHVEEYRMTWSVEQHLVKEVAVYAYRGDGPEAPDFLSDGSFDELVTFSIDLEQFRHLLPLQTGPSGSKFIQLPLKLSMKLNGTEVDAFASFQAAGQTYNRQAAKIVDALGA
ncbi:hypothetical protein OC845_005620 [Tilletia horrida]|nr:hypothetical protein OC845_005620 [Tilletia horrida]